MVNNTVNSKRFGPERSHEILLHIANRYTGKKTDGGGKITKDELNNILSDKFLTSVGGTQKLLNANLFNKDLLREILDPRMDYLITDGEIKTKIAKVREALKLALAEYNESKVPPKPLTCQEYTLTREQLTYKPNGTENSFARFLQNQFQDPLRFNSSGQTASIINDKFGIRKDGDILAQAADKPDDTTKVIVEKFMADNSGVQALELSEITDLYKFVQELKGKKGEEAANKFKSAFVKSFTHYVKEKFQDPTISLNIMLGYLQCVDWQSGDVDDNLVSGIYSLTKELAEGLGSEMANGKDKNSVIGNFNANAIFKKDQVYNVGSLALIKNARGGVQIFEYETGLPSQKAQIYNNKEAKKLETAQKKREVVLPNNLENDMKEIQDQANEFFANSEIKQLLDSELKIRNFSVPNILESVKKGDLRSIYKLYGILTDLQISVPEEKGSQFDHLHTLVHNFLYEDNSISMLNLALRNLYADKSINDIKRSEKIPSTFLNLTRINSFVDVKKQLDRLREAGSLSYEDKSYITFLTIQCENIAQQINNKNELTNQKNTSAPRQPIATKPKPSNAERIASAKAQLNISPEERRALAIANMREANAKRKAEIAARKPQPENTKA